MDALFAPAGRQDPFLPSPSTRRPGVAIRWSSRCCATVGTAPRRCRPPTRRCSSSSPASWRVLTVNAITRSAPGSPVCSPPGGRWRTRPSSKRAPTDSSTTSRRVPSRNRSTWLPGSARPLPFGVIADVIGVPKADQQWLEYAVDEVMASFANQRDPAAVEHGNTVVEEVLAYFDALLDERTATPADDLLSVLGGEPVDDDARPDLLANCMFFLVARHHDHVARSWSRAPRRAPRTAPRCTTHPDGMGAHGRGAVALPQPHHHHWHRHPEDVTVGDITFKAGPNRLPRVRRPRPRPAAFDEPNRFDISRTPTPHPRSPSGARTTASVRASAARLHRLRTLFTRAPGLRVVDGPTWRNAAPVRQLEPLLVRWL